MVFGPEVDGRKTRIEAIAAGPGDRLMVAEGAEQRLILVGANGAVQAVTGASVGLGPKSGFGAVAFDPFGAVLVTATEAARVSRLTFG